MKKFLVLLAAVASFNVSAVEYKEKQARSNDVASKYILETNGDFFRIVGNDKCQITSNVEDFKISMHKNDVAMVYFVKAGERYPYDLLVLKNSENTGKCPKAKKEVIMENVGFKGKKSRDYYYNVVSNTKTSIVNVALNARGLFAAWSNNSLVYKANDVVDYSMYQKYNVKGAKFNSYVLFALTDYHCIKKVDGDNPDASKEDCEKKWQSIKEFKEHYGLE